jgi:hypothetical protein
MRFLRFLFGGQDLPPTANTQQPDVQAGRRPRNPRSIKLQALLKERGVNRSYIAHMWREHESLHKEMADNRAESGELRKEREVNRAEIGELRKEREVNHAQICELEKELENHRATECIMCIDAKPVFAALPCGHLLYCVTCMRDQHPGICPLCRKVVESHQRIW